MRRLLALRFIFLSWCISTPSYSADDWSREDVARQTAYTILHVADWAQSRYIAAHPDRFYETNGILGKHPSLGKVNTYFAATLIGHYAITALLPAKYRPVWQYGTITVEAYYVLHNNSLGIGFKF